MSLLPVDQALARILSGVQPTAIEEAPLAEAYGRVLVAPLAARRTQPPFDASAMDGYAVRSADAALGAELRVIGESIAGKSFAGKVGAGEAVRIFTGAPVPEGADAVLIQEDARPAGDRRIAVAEAPPRGRYIRAAGLDFRAGQELLPAGRTLGMREIALAAAMNHATLPVRRRPRVAILSTGDELVPPGGTPGPDQIISSNSAAIAGYLAASGAAPFDLGIAPDEREATERAVAAAIDGGADILVTLGGASVGDRDLVRAALAARGMELDFWQIAMRPGKPLIFGRLGETRVLGLPGNPVSSIVCTLIFVVPLVAALLGLPGRSRLETAVLGTAMPENDNREDYVRAAIEDPPDGPPVATPFPRQDSSMLGVLASAGCLIRRAVRAPRAEAGARCEILRLP